MAYGRTGLVERVARSEAPVLLVTGDSGIGKSTVLQMSCAPLEGWIAVGPRSLLHSSGALYSGVLDQLGNALSGLADGGVGIPSMAERLAVTGRRLANEKVSVLARVALVELVAAVRGRLGDDLGKAVTEYAKDIWPDTAETLAAKAAQSRDPLAAEILCAFADATRELAEGTHVALAFDQGQRLSEDDQRLLGDLAEHLPSDVHLRVAFATDTADRTRVVTRMRADVPRIDDIEVPPLDEAAVREWLAADGLADSIAAPLVRQTAGYPLLVEAAIVHLKAGGELIEMPRNQQLAARTRASWQELSPPAAAVARKLAVLADPLPDDDLRRLAGVTDMGAWATVIAELRDARILSVDVNGQPWFHAERRALVLNECLTGAQRDEAAAAAASLVWSKGFSTTDFGIVGLFAQLVGLAPSYQSQEQHLAIASNLDGPALAAAAALLELAVQGMLASEADILLSHALTFIDAIADPSAAVAELEKGGLVVTASNDWATAVAAAWGPQTQAVIQGRSALRLRRTPVPRLVEAVFQLVLRDQLGEFEAAQFGIGSPSIGALGRLAVGAEPNAGYVNRQELGANLLLRGSLIDDMPLYCAASYKDAAARDEAKSKVSGVTSVTTVVGDVAIEQTLEHPVAPVATQRFAAALARARGDHLNPRDTGEIRLPAPKDVSDDELADLRVRTAQLLSELADPVEQMAMDLNRGFFLAWDADDELWDECVVNGAGFGQRRVLALSEASVQDHYEGLRLRRAIGLFAGQEVVHRSISGGQDVRKDPIATEIGYRRSRARIFNSAQPRLDVVLSRDRLQPLVSAAFKTELSDARTLCERLPVGSVSDAALGPRALWLLIVLDEPHPGWVAGARGMALYSEGSSPDVTDQVYVDFVQGEQQEDAWLYTVEHDLFSKVFPQAAKDSWGSSTIDFIVAQLLCHHPDDVQLVWP